MRQDDNDNLLWKQRRRWADSLTIISGYAKTCWAVNTPDTVDWLITQPGCTQAGANTRSLGAECISPLWEEITQTSRRWVAGSHTRWGKTNLHVDKGHYVCYMYPICRHLPDTQDTMNYLNALVCWAMIQWRPLHVSLSLTLSREEPLNHGDQTPCTAKCLSLSLKHRETLFCSTEQLSERKSTQSFSNKVIHWRYFTRGQSIVDFTCLI